MYDIHMDIESYLSFEWDDAKAVINQDKHAVTFEEAAETFSDPYARIIDDPDHSQDEQRFVLIGLTMSARVLTVCHCLRGRGRIIRIISARKATKNEEKQYWRCRS